MKKIIKDLIGLAEAAEMTVIAISKNKELRAMSDFKHGTNKDN